MSDVILGQYLEASLEMLEGSGEERGDLRSQSYEAIATFTDDMYNAIQTRLESAEWTATLQLHDRKKRHLAAVENELAEIRTKHKGTMDDYQEYQQNEREKNAEKKRAESKLRRSKSSASTSSGRKKAKKYREIKFTSAQVNTIKRVHRLEKEEKRLRSEVELDERSMVAAKDSCKVLREKALEAYLAGLESGSEGDIRVYRVCSLWFDHVGDAEMEGLVSRLLPRVPVFKFVPLVYQICSRLSSDSSVFQTALQDLVVRMACAHPHHVLYQVFALRNGDRTKGEDHLINESKIDAAQSVLDRVMHTSPELEGLVDAMDGFVEMYLALAEDRWDKKKKVPVSERKLSLTKSKSKVSAVRRTAGVVVVPSLPLGIEPDGEYSDAPCVHRIEDRFEVANGVHRPKIIEMLGTDGEKYKQLVKGDDDMRQDAVMEQVFALVNTFLGDHGSRAARELGVRTYKVVPLSPQAGFLQFVENTVPLGDYLVGTGRKNWAKSAHARYQPGDRKDWEVREAIEGARASEKRRVFGEQTRVFRPVLHKFFLEKYADPVEWYRRRSAYTRSVAVNSMLGYILGIGDRHSYNILLDSSTGEVIHIDLGIAFEQGKVLPTPELVPFRLTRDVVDGMGVTGVEGLFRASCEETLKVLRSAQDLLVTVLDVLVHDPLYRWSLSPLKTRKIQEATRRLRDVSVAPGFGEEEEEEDDDEEEEGGGGGEVHQPSAKEAKRVVFRVKQKLQGYEDGEVLSISGQVNRLILEARDEGKLCLMFPGWGAWV